MILRAFRWSLVGVAAVYATDAAMGYPVSQIVTQSTGIDFWGIAQNASPPVAALCLFFLLRVDSERRKLQSERDGLLERVLTGLIGSTTAINSVTSLLGGEKRD